MNRVAQSGHLLQSRAWGELKSCFGWAAWHVEAPAGAAQVLFRRLPLGATVAYVPKGPTVDWEDREACQALFAAIHTEAKRRRAVFLKVEPDVTDTGPGGAAAFLGQAGWRPGDTIQPRTSLVIDIRDDEAAILGAMKQKTRYNIRLAEKKGVTTRLGELADVATFYRLSRETAARDNFGIHSQDYYETAFTLFAPDRCALLLAEFQGQPLAALMVFCHGPTAYYLFGASGGEHRELMPAYLAQWAAVRWAKTHGCIEYDLWGIPDADEATLEAEFQGRQEGLWGVYRFKRGFGGRLVRCIGAYDYVYRPALYRLYRWWRRGGP